MKAVILAGGLGTRISEETQLKPKPMVEIGGKPILWHIMKTYSHYGVNEFVICCGYKGYVIKEYFQNYFLHMSDVTLDVKNNEMEVHRKSVEPWKITLVDTGIDTMTGGRLKRIKEYVNNETFCFTYGDGVSNINIKNLIGFHNKEKTFATVSAVQQSGKYGVLGITDQKVTKFNEKPAGDWINAGFFVLEPNIFDYLKDDSTIWEKEPLQKLASDNQLSVFKHTEFWQPMDTMREKKYLEELWNSGKAPWKIW
jgi:glucose-1-phosphate cytidylyltransferase